MAIRALNANFFMASNPNAKLKRPGWLRPRRDCVKLNVDGGFDLDLLQGTYGAVIRDSNREFIAVGNGKIEWCGDAIMAGAMALRFGLNLASSVGCKRTDENSDNMEVIEMVNNDGRSFGVDGAIFDDSYHIACHFPHVIFEHVSREANCVAHELAYLARRRVCNGQMEDPLDEIGIPLEKDATMITMQ